ALPPQRAQLDLSHVEPRAVLGRVMDLKPVGQALGLLGWERLIEAGRRVRVELVHDQHELLRLLVASLQQRADEARPVRSAAMLRHLTVAPALGGKGSRVSPISCLKVSSTHTTGRLGSYGRW